MSSINNKRIAKNTLFLYIRMIFVFIISLYTSRIIINALGVVDYGVNNVVAGFVSMFAFLNNSLANAVQRFYNYEGEKRGADGIKSVYSVAILIHVIIAVSLFVILEIFGTLYINRVLVVPPERLLAANWLFQFSIVSFVLVLLEIPFIGAIISFEKMDFYALVGIINVLLKLLLVILLPHIPYDKLIVFGVIGLLLSLTSFLFYVIYAKCKFQSLRFSKDNYGELTKAMLSFSGWNVFGTFAFIMKGQGVNMLLNYFFGPIVNSARGIASTVQGAIQSFSSNITVAYRPQLVSAYASNNNNRVTMIMYSASKACFVLLAVIITPLIVEMPLVLNIWLGEIVPEYAAVFASIVLLDTLLGTLNTPFTQIVLATGNIKSYQILTGLVNFLNIPISWFFLKIGMSPVSVFFISLVLTVFNQILSMAIARLLFDFGVKRYLLQVIVPCFLFFLLLMFIPMFLHRSDLGDLIRFILILIADVIIAVFLGYFIVCNKVEREMCNNFIRNKFNFKRE